MTDERLERDLRDWLAAEGDVIRLPDGMRARVAQLAPGPARSARAWSWPPRPALAAAVAGILVVAIAAGLVARGLLPVGRPDCSGVTFERVRAAAEAVPGYRYTMHGTELMGRPVFAEGDITTEYSTATFEVSGAYRAPDAWTLEVLSVENPNHPLPPSSLIWLLNGEWDAYIHVDGADYARAPGASRYTRLPPERLNLAWFGASRLTDLLVGGQPIRMSPTGEQLEREFEWSVTTTDDGCRLSATDPTLPDEPGMVWLHEFDVDPETLLPRSARHRLGTPEVPFASGSGAPANEYASDFTFDFSEVPEIMAPTDPEVPPVTEERAIGDAADAGAGPGGDTASLGRGSSELWVVRGTEGVAILLYENGLLASSAVVPKADDVSVEIIEGEQGRFLALVANDVRVSHVRVQLSESDTVQLPEEGSGGRPLAVVDAERLGDIITWFAYDENDRELVVNPRPPG